jgi:hypothetical protein
MEVAFLDREPEIDGTGGGITHCRGLGQKFLHPYVLLLTWIKSLTLEQRHTFCVPMDWPIIGVMALFADRPMRHSVGRKPLISLFP